MRILSLLVVPALLGLQSCTQFKVTAQAGYSQLALDGDIGYANGSTATNVSQDIESAFGLGDDQGTPYARLTMDTGVPVVTLSGFLFEDDGTGTLTADFGDINAGTTVRSDVEMLSGKASLAFKIALGPVAISPGLAVDYFDLDIEVSDAFGAITESVELSGPVPLGFLRGQVDIGPVGLMVEGGWMEVDIDDVTAEVLDIEAMVEFKPGDWIDLFVGYRRIALDASGLIDGDTYDTDISLGGWMIGGGVRF